MNVSMYGKTRLLQFTLIVSVSPHFSPTDPGIDLELRCIKQIITANTFYHQNLIDVTLSSLPVLNLQYIFKLCYFVLIGVGVSCRISYCFVSYLIYESLVVGEWRANFYAVVYMLLCGFYSEGFPLRLRYFIVVLPGPSI